MWHVSHVNKTARCHHCAKAYWSCIYLHDKFFPIQQVYTTLFDPIQLELDISIPSTRLHADRYFNLIITVHVNIATEKNILFWKPVTSKTKDQAQNIFFNDKSIPIKNLDLSGNHIVTIYRDIDTTS